MIWREYCTSGNLGGSAAGVDSRPHDETETRMAPMTPLNDDLTERRPRYVQSRPTGPRRPGTPAGTLRATNPEIWLAFSADGLWVYERTETATTPWHVTYLPTGQTSIFTTLTEARRWTASPHALPQLRAQARDVISRGGRQPGTHTLTFGPGGLPQRAADNEKAIAERLAHAMRWAAILDGTLVDAEPDARCHRAGPLAVCGGYLAHTSSGWVHVDACNECIGLMSDETRKCHNLTAHQACGDPDPVQCDHRHCGQVANLTPELCPRDNPACCDACCTVVCGADR